MGTTCSIVRDIIIKISEEHMSGVRRGAAGCVLALVSLVAGPTWAEEPSERPCAAAEYRQFDFWAGDWSVTTPDGKKAGDNRIEMILDGCALMENWTGDSGMRGHSFNIYSQRSGQWHQTWVDTNGTLLQLDGGIKDGKMVLTGSNPGPNGKPVHHEISWKILDDGRVLQHWRISKDGGATWSDAFVGYYARK